MPESTEGMCEAGPSASSYTSAIVLGMNDALVEMTGALAGFTMALSDNRLIALAGLTTGVAATLSMAASEFLSQEVDATRGRACAAAGVTGIAYLITVGLLLLPFFLLSEPLPALLLCLLFATAIIFVFTLVVSRLKHDNFLGAFLRMLTISFCVAAIAFSISWAARAWLGVSI